MAQLNISRHVTIQAAPDTCWAFWSEPLNFVRTFDVVTAAVPVSETRSRWTLNLPSGRQEEVLMERQGNAPESVAWVTVEGPLTFNTSFRFSPAGDGATALALETEIAMGGLQGMMLPAMKPVIEQRIDEVLRRFRETVEAA